ARLGWPRLNPEISPNDAPVFQQALEGGLHRVRWNREADPLRSATPRNDGRVDPDDFAAQIHQRPAAVSRIDRGVRLQVIAETVYAIRTSFRTDDPVGYRFFKSERIPDRHHEIAGLDRVRIAELQRFQPRLVDFEHRQIHDRIRANEFRLLRPAIAQLHLDLVHLVHHVTVRDD